jgi:hypothetical protein
MCFATNGSKRKGKTFTGFTVLDINYETMENHRTSNIASIFTTEELAIAERCKSSKSWIEMLRSTPKINNTSYLAWELRDKIKELEFTDRRIKSILTSIHCGIQINNKVDSGAKNAINNGKDSQLLLPSSDMKTFWQRCVQEKSHEFCLETGQLLQQIIQ